MNSNKFRQFLLLFLFSVLISFPLINQQFHLVKDTIYTENKAPLPKPKLSEQKINLFPTLYDQYYASNFTVRQRLIKDYYEFNLGLYIKSPHPEQVFIGKNNWLFMGGDENDSFTGSRPFSQKDLEQIKKELEYRQKYLKEKGTKFYFVIAPVKASVYPEYIPEAVIKKSKYSWAQQVNEFLLKNSSVPVIDLHETLWFAKKGGNVYFKNDNHWNYRAGLYSTNTIVRRIQKDCPQLKEISINDFNETVRTSNVNGNLILMLAQTERYVDSVYEYTPKNGFLAESLPKVGYTVPKGFPYPQDFELHLGIPGSQLPKLLIISDSFSNYLFPFIAERFSKTTKIFDNWEYKRNEDIIENEKPDIVILVIWEANLRKMLNDFSKF